MTASQAAQKEIARLRRELAAEKEARKADARKAENENRLLKSENRDLREEIRELRAAFAEAVAALRAEVADLKAQLARNSQNSSTPPSQDPPNAPAPKSLRRKTGRRPGGQAGHRGATLGLSDRPDEVVRHEPAACAGCGASLEGAPTSRVSRRQVVDIPPITPTITEHQIATKRCACGHETAAPAPAGVGARTQYGPGALALMVYFYQAQHLSLARAAEVFSDLLGTPVSPATILKASRQAAEAIGRDFAPAARKALAGGPVLHVDETSIRQGGKKAWLHSASNPEWTWITAHRKRGRAGSDAGGVLPDFEGVLVHDCWSVYDTYPQAAAHQLCAAHAIRELQAVADHHQADHPGAGWCWAAQAQDALRLAVHDPAQAGQARNLITSAASIALADPAKAGWAAGKTGKKHQALARRLKNRIDDYLCFATRPGVPPTNNPAEQEIRVAKIRAKISGTMRTMKGAQTFAAIRSYLSTARKHHQPPLRALASLTSPNTWIPATP